MCNVTARQKVRFYKISFVLVLFFSQSIIFFENLQVFFRSDAPFFETAVSYWAKRKNFPEIGGKSLANSLAFFACLWYNLIRYCLWEKIILIMSFTHGRKDGLLMKVVKSIDKKVLIEAGLQCMHATDVYYEVLKEFPDAKKLIGQRHVDARDLINIGAFLRFRKKFDGTGDVLTDEEHAEECRRMIRAFANDDREKIFEYLDGWYQFAQNYTAPEHIEAVDDAIKNITYVTSQQGLAITKLRNYPDYVLSRYPDTDSLMKLQRMASEVTMQSAQEIPLFVQHGFFLSTESFRPYASGKEIPQEHNDALKEAYASTNESIFREAYCGEYLVNSFDLNQPAPKDQVALRKATPPEIIRGLRGVDHSSEEFKAMAEALSNAVRTSIGTEVTGFGLFSDFDKKYSDRLTDFRMIFIDGVSIYDSLPEPKNVDDASAKLLDAICNQTGVVTFAHITHIKGQFEYRMDVLDTRTGEGDNPEYLQKIAALEESEQYRKAVFSGCADNLSNLLVPAYENYIKNGFAKIGQEAKKEIAKGFPAFHDTAADSTTVDNRNVGVTFYIIDEIRREYLHFATPYLKQHPEVARSFESRNFDLRDFQDLIIFTKLARTLGVGDADLSGDEMAVEVPKMLDAFYRQDHEAITPYLDKMYNFLADYKPPKSISTTDELLKACLYLRVQQTSAVKLKECPWYLEEKHPGAIGQAKFDAFEADYYITFDNLLRTVKRYTQLRIGAGQPFIDILEFSRRMRAMEDDRAEDEIEYDRMVADIDTETSVYYPSAHLLASERLRLLEETNTPDGDFTFKLQLPNRAMACIGDNVLPSKFSDEASDFHTEFIDFIYNASYTESKVIRNYRFPNTDAQDTMRLIFLDGKSVYDVVTANGQRYNGTTANKAILSALINQSALVQFAHVSQGDDGLHVELDTLDVSGRTCNRADYLQKLADFESNRAERHAAIKAHINEVFAEHKKAVEDRIASNEKYKEEAVEQEAGILGMENLFDAEEPRKREPQISEEEIDRRRRNAEYRQYIRKTKQEMAESLASAEVLDLSTFKDGRYSASPRAPHSAYALASMSELRNLEVYFGGMRTEEYPKDYVGLADVEAPAQPKDYNSDSETYATVNGLNINKMQLHNVMQQFVQQNLSPDGKNVDKTIFERQYMILFGDLYIRTLHSLNRRAVANNTTITASQMDNSLNMLDEMMQDVAKDVGYPEAIFRGGFTPEGLKTLRSNFVEKFVPKTMSELALRRMQANEKNYDFADPDWKKHIGYTAFLNLINTEKGKLNSPDLKTPEGKRLAVQTVRMMNDYHNSRSLWSRFWNFRKSAKELRAIDSFKTLLQTNADLCNEDFEDLYETRELSAVEELPTDLQTLYGRDVASAKLGEMAVGDPEDFDEIMNHTFVSEIGMAEKDESVRDFSEDSFNMNEIKFSAEKSENSVDEQKPLVEKITAPEANEKADKKPARDQAKENARKDLENKITRL